MTDAELDRWHADQDSDYTDLDFMMLVADHHHLLCAGVNPLAFEIHMEVIERDPENVKAHFYAGLYWCHMSEEERALPYFQSALGLCPPGSEEREYIEWFIKKVKDGGKGLPNQRMGQ